ncbi:CDP-glycerol glycerophosphotransferase, TagB/SpsB family [Pilibacter termitis]|uniref:CDP-glycerol glycerophosphotransferase, TagB/SpsB family n=1 Tax=Pilibacter termitis TaxID=263852 RepID=A0A1T4KHM4_9ENTE|nr:CDP-glycerol glycerophosphotransferase family protein [Pilibacter termitis]SJZ41929.1 CDP-glycerol glycerophosphotransferase, TagB/SpsB family [Pilibacter termitis]
MLKTAYMNAVHFVSQMHAKGETEKVVYLMSFSDNNTHLLNELANFYENRLVVCYTKNTLKEALRLEKLGVEILCLDEKRTLFRKILPILSKTKLILADNYFVVLGGIEMHPEVKVIQLWHAVGAMKKFGWDAVSTAQKSANDKARYTSVYAKFTHFVVASEKMARVFEQSWLAGPEKMLKFGNPRCDVYFDKEFLKKSKEKFLETLPEAKEKKVIMYAPTFREAGFGKVPLGLKQMNAFLERENLLLYVRLHPKEIGLQKEIQGYSSICSSIGILQLEEILPNIDLLISDYSSVPFEYTLAKPEGKLFFYVPDCEQYEQEVGLSEGYREWVPGEIFETQGELMRAIQEFAHPKEEEISEDVARPSFKRVPITFAAFNQLWNTKNNGMATQRLMDYLKAMK